MSLLKRFLGVVAMTGVLAGVGPKFVLAMAKTPPKDNSLGRIENPKIAKAVQSIRKNKDLNPDLVRLIFQGMPRDHKARDIKHALALELLLTSKNSGTRWAAFNWIDSKRGDRQRLFEILEYVGEKDAPYVRLQAADLLHELGKNESAIAIYSELAKDKIWKQKVAKEIPALLQASGGSSGANDSQRILAHYVTRTFTPIMNLDPDLASSLINQFYIRNGFNRAVEEYHSKTPEAITERFIKKVNAFMAE
ncbi:MAG: hypothetical protein COB53_03255 [Elusimicrobia bacterium]|nr:MAG: hypothetical protein COB53_03255 [Elusimicrobiota bacterium]